MLVTFTTKAYADITMFGDIAQTLLKLMGHSGTVPGAIREEDVPDALSRLRAIIDGKTAAPPAPGDHDGGTNGDEPPISLKNRALPLVALFEAAARDKTYVSWK